MFTRKAQDGRPEITVVPSTQQPAVERTTAGLRDFLFHELDAFVRGSTTPERIRSVTQVANAIVDSARLELEFARLVKTRGKGMKTGTPRPVRLVKRKTLKKAA